MYHIQACPVCGHDKFSEFLQCPDHFLSGEVFTITECLSCGLRFTNPVPEKDKLPNYYKSEEYISHSNIKKGLVNSIYHYARNYTVRRKYRLVDRYAQGKRILDIGSGTGELLGYFRSKEWQTMGYEPDEGARAFAIRQFQLDILHGDELESTPPDSFDVISMWHVLEHIEDLDQLFQQIKRLLAGNGTFIVAVPICESWDARHYGPYWAAYDVPRHLYHFTRETMKSLAEKYGFSLFRTFPMKLDAYYISMLSEKYKRGRPHIPAAFFKGFYSNLHARIHNKNYSSLIFLFKFG